MKYILGLDFGGTKLAAGLVNASNGDLIASAFAPTPKDKTAHESLEIMFALIEQLFTNKKPITSPHSKYSIKGIGVSFGGPVEKDNKTVRFSMHVSGWDNFALAQKLEKEFHAPALIANDADAAALAEYRFGAGRGVKHMLYFTVSTGIGGGVIINGQLYRGEHAWAGEVGHMTLKPDGPVCPCGRNGCLESLASGLSVARLAREHLKHPAPKPRLPSYKVSMLHKIPRDQITARDVAEAASKGDVLARLVWNESMEWLGIGVASAANLLNPGRVVIGGGLTRAGALLFTPVQRIVAERVLDPDLKVVPAELADNVGILGGAALFI